MKSLEAIQEWLFSAIQRPTAAPGISEMVRDDHGQLTPVERLEIYGKSFYGRLLQVLEGEFPVLRHAMEPDLFEQFGGKYLGAYPPGSYTLTDLGKNFPKYLRDTRPEDSSELWPEFLIELATLERVFSEVYQSDGPENHEIIPADDFDGIAAEPWTRVLNCHFPVHSYFLAVRRNEDPDLPIPEETTLLVYRRDFRVRLRGLPRSNREW